MEHGYERVLNTVGLFTGNDQKAISRALRMCEEITMERTLGERTVLVKTVPGDEVWGVPMLVHVKIIKRGPVYMQYFARAEDAVKFANGG